MSYTYKILSTKDTSLLKELLHVFSEAFDDPESYQSAVPTDDYIKSFLAMNNAIVIVALDGQKVVGGLVAYELVKFEQARKEIYLYDLAVLAEHRRRGIAKGLIAELQLEAKKRGADVIYVQADHGDEPAIRLYESLGRKENVYHFDITP